MADVSSLELMKRDDLKFQFVDTDDIDGDADFEIDDDDMDELDELDVTDQDEEDEEYY